MMFDGKRFTGIDPSYGTIKAYAVNKRQDGSETSMNELSVKPCNEVNSWVGTDDLEKVRD